MNRSPRTRQNRHVSCLNILILAFFISSASFLCDAQPQPTATITALTGNVQVIIAGGEGGG